MFTAARASEGHVTWYRKLIHLVFIPLENLDVTLPQIDMETRVCLQNPKNPKCAIWHPMYLFSVCFFVVGGHAAR